MVNPKNMHQLSLKIYGRVQGVYFRHTTKQTADALGIVGWVKNCPDGCVEVLAQGDEEKLVAVKKFCERGSEMAKVERIEEVWQDIQEQKFERFEIV